MLARPSVCLPGFSVASQCVQTRVQQFIHYCLANILDARSIIPPFAIRTRDSRRGAFEYRFSFFDESHADLKINVARFRSDRSTSEILTSLRDPESRIVNDTAIKNPRRDADTWRVCNRVSARK